MSSTRFADLIVGLVAGAAFTLTLCGTGHASSGGLLLDSGVLQVPTNDMTDGMVSIVSECLRDDATGDVECLGQDALLAVCAETGCYVDALGIHLLYPDTGVMRLGVNGNGHLYTIQDQCPAQMESVMREQETLEALERQVRDFYGYMSSSYVTVSDATDTIPIWSTTTPYRIGDYLLDPNGLGLLYFPEPDVEPYHPPVKKTEEEIYQEKKAKILAQIVELDEAREREQARAAKDARYHTLVRQLEETRGALIVHWSRVKTTCWREPS